MRLIAIANPLQHPSFLPLSQVVNELVAFLGHLVQTGGINSHEWIEFEGTLSSQPLMGGYSNVDDLVLDVAGRSISGRSAAILRLEDPAVVNLVARQPDATRTARSTHERDLQGRCGSLLRG